MPTTPAASEIVQLENQDPYPFYESLAKSGCPVHDPGLQAWLVPTYAESRDVLRDDTTYRKFDDLDKPDEFTVQVYGGSLRRLSFLEGDEHRAFHRWWLEVFHRDAVNAWRADLIRPIVDASIDRFVSRGHADLWDEFAQRIPVRAISAIIGLDWTDDHAMDTMSDLIDVHGEFFNQRPNPTPEITRAAARAVDDFRSITDELVHSRANGEGEDVVSRLWRDGRALFPDWSAYDVQSQLHNMFLGGKDTTSLGIANAMHRLLTDRPLHEHLVATPGDIEDFVEESLRLDPPTQYRARYSATDVDTEQFPFHQGDTILPLLAAANRDPRKFECPSEVKLGRRVNHLTFGTGPRRCVGAALARAEINEVVGAILKRIPDLAFAPDAPAPTFGGRMLRAWRPLQVAFTPH